MNNIFISKTDVIGEKNEYRATKKDILNLFSTWLDERCIDSTKLRASTSPFVFTIELIDA